MEKRRCGKTLAVWQPMVFRNTTGGIKKYCRLILETILASAAANSTSQRSQQQKTANCGKQRDTDNL
jgi:hypothetical protein